MRRLLMPVLAGLLVGACGILGPDEKRVVGELVYVAVPNSVLVGEPFTVTVVTIGDQCYWKGETEVRIQGNVATIAPNVYVDMSPDACPLAPNRFAHEATVRFLQVGEAVVVFRGRDSRRRWPLYVY